MSEHTPTPWILELGHADWGMGFAHTILPEGADGSDYEAVIAEIPSKQPYCMGASRKDINFASRQRNNAAFIVEACNNYEPLQELLKIANAQTEEARTERDELLKQKDIAESTCTAWQHAFEGIEAHIMDRISVNDPANPETYLRIIHSGASHIIERSKQISAARWADHKRQEDRIGVLQQERDELVEALGVFVNCEWTAESISCAHDKACAILSKHGRAGK